MDRLIIGLAGKARAGKDEVADILVKHFAFTKMSSVDPVKKAAAILSGYAIEHFNAEQLKEKELEFWGISGRVFTQDIGMFLREKYGEDFLLRRLELAMQNSPKGFSRIVLTNCRFDNETAWVRKQGGFVFHVDGNYPGRKEIPASDHATERGVTRMACDYMIMNDGTLADLKKTVHHAMIDAGFYP